jgi:hypothetical protein
LNDELNDKIESKNKNRNAIVLKKINKLASNNISIKNKNRNTIVLKK